MNETRKTQALQKAFVESEENVELTEHFLTLAMNTQPDVFLGFSLHFCTYEYLFRLFY